VESFFGRVAFEGEGFAEDVLGRSYSGLSVEVCSLESIDSSFLAERLGFPLKIFPTVFLVSRWLTVFSLDSAGPEQIIVLCRAAFFT